jgi:hypothetical protein
MSEPTPEAPAPESTSEEKPASPWGFLVGLVGGPLLFLFSVWLIDVTGRFFFVLALAGVLAFAVGVVQALVFAVRSLVTRPVPSVAVLAVLAGLGFLAAKNSEALRAWVTRLGEAPVLGGRYAGDGFSLEYPQGWRQKDIDGFEIAGIRPSGTGHGKCLDNAGVMRSRKDDYTLETYVQRQRDDYGTSEHWNVLEDKPATVGGLPGRELMVRGATHDLHLYVTVKDGRGYIVSTQLCREEADEDRERVLQAVAQSFQL